MMAETPTSLESYDQSRQKVQQAIAELRAGNFSVRIADDDSEIARDLNAVAEQLGSLASELHTLSRSAREGKFGGQIETPLTGGGWSNLVRDVNDMSADQVTQFRGTALAITSIANGDFSSKAPLSAAGEALELNKTLNVMADQYALLRDEVGRAADRARGGATPDRQIEVRGASGAWSDLLNSINFLASTANSGYHTH
jgi:methyl-accepting chemotaxis protein